MAFPLDIAGSPTWPDLSRAPQMDEEEDYEDSGIKDKAEDGYVYTRPRYTRIRQTLKVNYKLLTFDDRTALRTFMRCVGSWMPFVFPDNRDPENPENLTVRFTKLPSFKDGGKDGFANGAKTFTCSFEVQEV